MKGLCASVSLALLIACSASDDVYLGSRGNCEFGGTLTDCENADRTVKDACWRLVDCGAIPLHYEDPNDSGRLDWDNCVEGMESTQEDRRQVMIACIAASTCDELRTDVCLDLGDF